jgi:lipopolysaccharide/colanic/teichoic acid biosynthesis glycosyltransferase
MLKKNYTLVRIAIDVLIYTVVFKIIESYRVGTLKLSTAETFYCLPLILISVLIPSLVMGKYKKSAHNDFIIAVSPIFKTLLTSLGLITIYFNLFSESFPSRILIGGTIVIGSLIEILIIFINSRFTIKGNITFSLNIPPLVFLYELILFTTILSYPYIKNDNLSIISDILPVSIQYVIWFISGIFIYRKKSEPARSNYWHFIWKRIKGYAFLIALTSLMIYLLSPEGLSSITPLYISIVYSFSSMFVNTLFFIIIYQPQTDEANIKFVRASLHIDEPLLQEEKRSSIKHSLKNPFNHYLNDQFREVYLKKFPLIYQFIDETIDLFSLDFRKCFMIRSSDTYNIEIMPDNTLELYMNIHEINDIRRINEYLINVNTKLVSGGFFIGVLEPNSLRKNRFMSKYPSLLANIFYFFDFIWKRFFPKMPLLKNLYFALTRGKNRAISLSEIIGRIFFCGFDLINLKQIGNLVYFVAVKKNPPSTDTNPSYGPFIKLKRIGLAGKTIYVYKFRTMYPYSEYLQSFVYKKTNLQSGGKFKDDFRITSWGAILRKLWIDEWPMLINFFKGQLKIVGIRPLSIHYFNLYPEKLKERRIMFKPGLVPPFYADLPKTFEEILASEEKYLDSYEKHPILTDLSYFFKAANNILFRHARSK